MLLPILLIKTIGEENSRDYGYGCCQSVGEEQGKKTSVLYLVKR
jgi:hypothetical protein